MMLRYYLAIALFAVYSGFLYRIGSAPYRAELKALHAAADAQNAHTASIDAATKGIAHDSAQTAAHSFTVIDRAFPVKRVRKPDGSGVVPTVTAVTSGTGSESAPIESDPDRCTDRDSAHDAAQLILLQAFYEDLRAAQGR